MSDTKKLAHTISQLIQLKHNQGYAVRVGNPDYDSLLIHELCKLEAFSDTYAAELNCLSKCIRRYIWKSNTKALFMLLQTLNDSSEIIADIITPEIYWNLDTIIQYVYHLKNNTEMLGITDVTVFDEIIDQVQIAGAKRIISKQWEDILSCENGNKAFLDIFDDIFTNAIEKYESQFIHQVEHDDVLCRMVKEKSCVEDRFIPWPNKVQNRWNPPGKTYLYLSYCKTDVDYNDELTLGEYICLLENKLDSEVDTCFCRFRPTKAGRVLDLSYNDLQLSDIRNTMEDGVNSHTESIIETLLEDEDILAHKDDSEFVKKKIESIMNDKPVDHGLIEITSTKQILKLICSCIYEKVDEKDPSSLEKAYKSFQILAEYLENKGITGIVYPCTRTKRIQGKNLVLFDIHDAEPINGSIKQYHFYKY